eukprot:CAMPEP_0206547890 /NCGR_PEP_ID=MMETSP0325_2-20121206/13560_1 /ASSEMBLY_ACC=CAM_ASM_000347 /TAXON_ID=2866 /ORGANISM="Crypthecodinium cohnii, Strain Seligo" /LENGTH=799 /DNA_ID=CAMNT_0054047271 /DNA_START=185 /DNA_END=2585 /DNA_ORIENTATION=+
MGAQSSCRKVCSKCTADCAKTADTCGEDFDEERPTGDPAGTTFDETLEDLSGVDRQLMLFCSSSNLSAVRWLLQLGGHVDVCDTNGTSCLHVACRSGSVTIVLELLRYQALLNTCDCSGWTPLHIAVLMGRKEVVMHLLQAGAALDIRNLKGLTPIELCSDRATYEVVRACEAHRQNHPNQVFKCPAVGLGEDATGSRLQYEPFFVPRQPIVRMQHYKKEFQRIGTLIFNRHPGFGLAFLVAAGVTRDYPVDVLLPQAVEGGHSEVGSFLGEAYSLSHTIRLEFVNSVVLQGTGVVSALIQVFHLLQLPDDLQKINRLVHGVSRIWWRQHERLQRDIANGAPLRNRVGADIQLHLNEELGGLELKQYFTSSEVLHQLMFSTVLLHWYVYRDGHLPRREMDFFTWRRLNSGIEQGAGDVPDHVQRGVHSAVTRAFLPELSIASPQTGSSHSDASTVAGTSTTSNGDAAAGGVAMTPQPPSQGPSHMAERSNSRRISGPTVRNRSFSNTPAPQGLQPYAAMEGWVQLVGGGFPKPAGMALTQAAVTYKHVSKLFSEVTQNSGPTLGLSGPGMMEHPSGGMRGDGGLLHTRRQGSSIDSSITVQVPSSGRDDHCWLSLCQSLLFFSLSPELGYPYAFLELPRVVVASLDEESRLITFAGAPEDVGASREVPSDPEAVIPLDAEGGTASPTVESVTLDGDAPMTPNCRDGFRRACQPPVNIILLLPDGRWQELSLQKLELRVPSREDLQVWSMHLVAACQGQVLGAADPSPTPNPAPLAGPQASPAPPNPAAPNVWEGATVAS